MNDIICPYGSPNWIAKYWSRIYVCRISRSSTEDTFVIYELWHKGGKPDSGWGQRGNRSGRGQYHDYRALICDLLHRTLEAGTFGMCYPQQSSNCAWAISLDGKKRFLGAHGVATEAAEPAWEGRRGWLMNVLGCLLKVDSIIFTRNRSPWRNSPWPLRNKGQSFYHRVFKKVAHQVEKGLWENILWFLQTFVDSLPALKSGNIGFRENTGCLPGQTLQGIDCKIVGSP